MTSKNYITIGNITTIVNTIIVVVAGYLFGLLTGFFGSLPFSEAQLAGVISAVVFLIFGYVNAKKHNNFFDKENDQLNVEVDLDGDTVKTIQELIDFYQANNTITVDKSEKTRKDDDNLVDIDPSLEYENDGC